MATLQIDLFDQTNNRRLWVSLRDNLPIGDLIHKLIVDLELPQGEYVLIDQESNQRLSIESNLRKEGVKNEQILRLQRKKKVPVVIPIPSPESAKEAIGQEVAETLEKIKEDLGDKLEAYAKDQLDKKFAEGVIPEREAEVMAEAAELPAAPPRIPQPRATGGFWFQPLRQPRFIAWIPVTIWRFTAPILILSMALLMICCFLMGLSTCFIGRQTRLMALLSNPTPTQIHMSTSTPVPTATPKPIVDCEDVLYTYENISVLDNYQSGQYKNDPESPSGSTDLEELIIYFSDMQGIVVFSISPEDQPGEKTELVLVAINEAEDLKTGANYACLANPENGETYLAQFDLLTDTIKVSQEASTREYVWSQPALEVTNTYAPEGERCWHYTYFLGFNLNTPPMDNVELRRALVLGFDNETYNMRAFGTTEGIANGFAPDAILQTENVTPADRIGNVFNLEEARRLFENVKTTGWAADYPDPTNFLMPQYCNSCEGSDTYAAESVKIWEGTLGISGQPKGDKYSSHFTPISGSNKQMYLMTQGATNFYRFIYNSILEGWIMLPEKGETKVLGLLDLYANESDPEKRIEYINEIERLIIVEYAVAIPINTFDYCE